MRRLVALLNQANLIAEAASALGLEGNQSAAQIPDAIDSAADAIAAGRPGSRARRRGNGQRPWCSQRRSNGWRTGSVRWPTGSMRWQPDFGSVFARAVQRGLGTVTGAVLGAVIIVVVPYGPWLLIPFGLLAALLPYGRSRNYGLMSVFLTPLVVVLIDLLAPGGWRLAEDRLSTR